MSKFKPAKFYIAKDGTTSTCFMNENVLLATHPEMRIMERDHRRMLFEISKRGDVYIFFGDNEIHLTKEQFQQISGLRKNLIIWE